MSYERFLLDGNWEVVHNAFLAGREVELFVFYFVDRLVYLYFQIILRLFIVFISHLDFYWVRFSPNLKKNLKNSNIAAHSLAKSVIFIMHL